MSDHIPPTPWTVEESPWGHVYLKDARDKRIATMLGTYDQKFDMACFVCDIAKRISQMGREQDATTQSRRREREDGVDEVLSNYARFINERPELLSLLYDIDMLPEQCVSYAGAVRMAGLCEVWKKLEAAEIARDEAVEVVRPIGDAFRFRVPKHDVAPDDFATDVRVTMGQGRTILGFLAKYRGKP